MPSARVRVVQRDVHEAQMPAAWLEARQWRTVAAEHDEDAARAPVSRHVHHLAVLRRAGAVVRGCRLVAQRAAAHVVVHEPWQHGAGGRLGCAVVNARHAAKYVGAVARVGRQAADGGRQFSQRTVAFVEHGGPGEVCRGCHGHCVVELQTPQGAAA